MSRENKSLTKKVEVRARLHLSDFVKDMLLRDASKQDRRPAAIISRVLEDYYLKQARNLNAES